MVIREERVSDGKRMADHLGHDGEILIPCRRKGLTVRAFFRCFINAYTFIVSAIGRLLGSN